MRLLHFFATHYVVTLEVDGIEHTVTLPWDACGFPAIRDAMQVEHNVTLPEWSQTEWYEQLNMLIAGAIAEGRDLAPLCVTNRVITERPQPRKH